VRVISFSVNDSIKNVQNAKKTETHIKCKISYNDYEASFNQKLWADVSKDIDQEQKQAADDFRKQQTIDCPP
jgi:flagellar biosynthesis regulator FlaF